MTNTELEQLLAQQQIREVLYRYCRGLDRMDRALARSVVLVPGLYRRHFDRIVRRVAAR